MTQDAMAPGWLADQLPRPLAEDHSTRQMLRIFEEVGASVRGRAISFRHDLDVGLAPIEFVRWMGEWLALAAPPSLPEPRVRDLVSAAGATWKWRGTTKGLTRLLETITGGTVEIDDGGGVFGEGQAPPNQKKLVVRLSERGGIGDDEILAFVRLEVPANVSVEIHGPSGPARAAPPEEPAPDEPAPTKTAPAEPAGKKPGPKPARKPAATKPDQEAR